MRFISFVVLLLTLTISAQNKALEIKIDSINTKDVSERERTFTINYHIKNLSEKPVTFLLNTSRMIPVVSGSQQPVPYFKIYQNDESVDVSGIFTTGEGMKFDYQTIVGSETNQDSINKILGRLVDKLRKDENAKLLENIIFLKSNESKSFSVVLGWDKKRYHKQDVYEYYLDEKAIHHIEISANLMREEFKSKLSPEQYQIISSDKNFVKGWFVSDKQKINLGD